MCTAGHRWATRLLDDARHLHPGFVAYPPLTSLAGRLSLAVFGVSLRAFRLPAALANAVSLVLAGLIARELGGGRTAQLLTLLACLPIAVAFSSVLQYTTFDLLAWTITLFFCARLLANGNRRNWLGVGAGTLAAVMPIYQDLGGSISQPPSTMAALVIELGLPMAFLVTAMAAWLVAILYRFPYSLILGAMIIFLAAMPWLGLTVLAGCAIASASRARW